MIRSDHTGACATEPSTTGPVRLVWQPPAMSVLRLGALSARPSVASAASPASCSGSALEEEPLMKIHHIAMDFYAGAYVPWRR